MSALPETASTGVMGLDSILQGGLPYDEMHLIQGAAGTGKTTLALQFLRAGLDRGEQVLYVTLSQSREQLARIAASYSWSLERIHVHELAPGTLAERMDARQSVLPTGELEIEEILRDLVAVVKRTQARRAVLDSLSILELLSVTPQSYQRDVVTIRQLFLENRCTLLAILDVPTDSSESSSDALLPLAGCVIGLRQCPQAFGGSRRHVRVIKARALPINGGSHDCKIKQDGLHVYPRLGAYEQTERADYRVIPSGVTRLDAICGGGVETGSSCLIVGAPGVGKSTIATLYATALAEMDARAAMFLFDERPQTYVRRADLYGTPLRRNIEAGRILLEQVDPGEIAPGEFANHVSELVEHQGVKLVVIDSVVGYFAAMGAANVLVTQLHELMTYLTRKDVSVIMCGAQVGFMSIGDQESVDVSYVSDTVIALAFFEEDAVLRRAVVVVKKKTSLHQNRIYELILEPGRIRVGEEPLRGHANLMVPGARRKDEA